MLIAALSLALAIGASGAVEPPPCRGADGYEASFGGRRTFLLRPDQMAALRRRGLDTPAGRDLLKDADDALKGPLYSVTRKTRTPPSGDKHDYMSMGPYWWPDPAAPGGPYIRRDGEVNPERASAAFDLTSSDRMSSAVQALSLAYFYTGERRYAVKAGELVRAWFLDPSTRMNPNAEFAQGVPGRVTGRAEGVLDSYRFLPVIEAVGLIAPAKVLTRAEQAGLEHWFSDYVDWMLTSRNGGEEQAAANNHAIWFDAQVMRFALFARRPELARRTAEAFLDRRIAKQVEPDGRMPEELKRTRALHYSAFAVWPAAEVADLGRCVGVDLWRAQTADGRSLAAAVRFLAGYVGRERSFPYPELRPDDTGELLEVVGRAAWALRSPELGAKQADLARRNPTSRINLTQALNASRPEAAR